MSQRAEALASQFEQAHQAFVYAVEGMSDRQWQMSSAEEGWTVAAAAHHVAQGHQALAGFVQAASTGQPLPPITPDQLNAANAQHARDFAQVSKAEVLALANKNGPAAAAAVRGLSDSQLDQPAATPFGGEMTTEQIIRNVLIGHVQMHLASIQAAR